MLSALSLTVLSLAQSNSGRPDLYRFNGFTLPVELTKTIKADKAEVGDPVQFHMLEPVLAGKGVVIPAKAKLYGKVVLANRAGKGQYSYLALQVDRAEWDGRTFPLNAFLVGWEKSHSVRSAGPPCPVAIQPDSPPRHSPGVAGAEPPPVPNDCNSSNDPSRWDDPSDWSERLVTRDIEIHRDANSGSTVLMSKKNIRLPAGTLIVLENVDQSLLTATKH